MFFLGEMSFRNYRERKWRRSQIVVLFFLRKGLGLEIDRKSRCVILSCMRYRPLSADFYRGNRARLCESLSPDSLVILNSNDIYPTNADGTLPFVQNTDFFYLSGIDQEESVLVLFPGASDPAQREILFIKKTSETIAIWEGAKLSLAEAATLSGIKNVQWLDNLESVLASLIKQVKTVYLNANEHLRAQNPVDTRDARFTREMKATYPLHSFARVAPLVAKLRQIKQKEEIEALQTACSWTKDAVLRLARFIRPGVGEWEIEAELAHEFTRKGARFFAFAPIIASGKSSCVLHYTSNDKVCQEGDLVLIDMGTENGYYNSDITRVFPVSGKFSPRQRAVYEAVYRIHKAAFSLLRPGKLKKDYEKEVAQVVEKELLGLGLLTAEEVAAQSAQSPAYRKYYMHGCSHFLGLDVHDVGESNPVLEEGMVFTIEPGIYIPAENIGIRLENDVLIGKDGNIDLMADIPLHPDDIEAAMRGEG